MYLFAGFIQLLLILSQSHYMPDMSLVWNSAPEPVVAAYQTLQTKKIQKPLSTSVYPAYWEVACCNNRNDADLTPARQPVRIFVIPLSMKLPSVEVIGIYKLYLLFCQLKIGG